MKPIFIDGLGLVEGHFSGVGQYILGIIRGLDQLIDEAKYNGEPVPEVKVIIPRNTVAQYKKFGFKHIGYKRLPFSFRVTAALWHRGWLPPINLWCGRGTYIFPRFVDMPLLRSKSAGLVIFDLSYELHREYSDEKNAVFLSEGVRRSLNRTKKVIAISQNAKKEIVDFYKLSESDVVVATPATDPTMFYRRSEAEIKKVKRKYGITGKYFLALSNLEPRKNLNALVDAYCSLPKEITDDVGLLLVGVNGWKTDKLFQKIIDKVQAGYNIIRPAEYVSDADKPAIISGATLLIYPSHYEGFGMPPLEALACGVPVIAADNSSLPEVVGEAGLLIKNDPEHIAEAITQYLKKYDEVQAQVLVRGPEKAIEFSWKESAKVFLEVAKEAES